MTKAKLMDNLENKIMNLQTTSQISEDYKKGHRDARHAAAELVANVNTHIDSLENRLMAITQEMAQQSVEYLKKIEHLRDERDSAKNGHEAQIRNTLAFQSDLNKLKTAIRDHRLSSWSKLITEEDKRLWRILNE